MKAKFLFFSIFIVGILLIATINLASAGTSKSPTSKVICINHLPYYLVKNHYVLMPKNYPGYSGYLKTCKNMPSNPYYPGGVETD